MLSRLLIVLFCACSCILQAQKLDWQWGALQRSKGNLISVLPADNQQFSGMGKDLYEQSELARSLFAKANEILGFDIQSIMFEGSDEALKQTNVTQPAIFLHSTILAACLGESFVPDMVAGHSLGEFSALVANKTLTFEDGLRLVSKRALAMQDACEKEPSTMAAILGLEDDVVEEICGKIESKC